MVDWSRWRNPVQNFVNLGGLYQGPTFKVRPPFKLGEIRPGWAYFEDGSVFFPRFPYTREELQEVMKVAACFVRNPSDGKRTLQMKDDSHTRMVLLEKLSPHPIFGPGNLHIYGRYVKNGENLLVPSTRYSAIMLGLDSTRSTHVSTEFASEQVFPSSRFLSLEQWIKSSRTFRGTLVDGVLQPEVRLGNGLKFTLNPKTARADTVSEAAALEPTLDEKDQEQELNAIKSPIEAEWQREFQYLHLSDFLSATSFDPPLDSSLNFDLRRGFERLESIEGGLSLSEYDLDLKQREGELKRLVRTLSWEQDMWRKRHISGLKSAADELELQKRRLETQLESQLERQEAWGCCEDDALKRANMEERERVLKAEVEQLKWMQMNWLWFNRFAKVEERLKQVARDTQDLKRREKRLEQELKGALEKGQRRIAASERAGTKRTVLPQEKTKISTPSSGNQKQAKMSAPPKGEAMSIFEFLNEDDTNPSDALELFRRTNGKV